MRTFLWFGLLLSSSSMLMSQSFRPYHAYGFQVNANFNTLSKHNENIVDQSVGSDLYGSTLRFDLLGNYEFGVLKWLGVGTGLGLSMRGGANNPSRSSKKRRDIFYLNLPATVQIKPLKFLWLETGVEMKYLLWSTDVGYNDPDKPFPKDELNQVDVNAIAGLRFNLFRGLSLNLGYHQGLTDVANFTFQDRFYGPVVTSYRDFGIRFGVRYMFNQPK